MCDNTTAPQDQRYTTMKIIANQNYYKDKDPGRINQPLHGVFSSLSDPAER